MRIDADILEWFKAQRPEGGYQGLIRDVLRAHMEQQRKESK
jgi:uncharacterized protein (DUF4415 family)